ncbi:hypothetical protein [Frigoriglobus tundricola]|uniref:Uncharacterized protein n=1 Tax=Frigoriglobus tundricola TaxID=2774151 RepID=A0A6M5YW25_9BACT|nr:hypothetical protein [Frigoriglobus tundricola]QJW97112.1 hypothetical protein FTUN_4677 [Frigoriglobus tundricola]
MRYSRTLAASALLANTAPVRAGMPSVTLSDAASLRLQSISFFLVLFLISALAVRWIWNGFRTDFPRLPHLSYLKALGLVGLWGLLFLLVLTMISGARELMTPGAWKKDGLTYALANETKPATNPVAPAGPTEDGRRLKLTVLFGALAVHAAAHDGRFPSAGDSTIAPDLWRTPHASGMRYVYLPNRTTNDPGRVLACEPELFGEGRLVLFTNGDIRRMTSTELAPILTPEAK